MKKIFAAAILAVSAMSFVGCASKHQEGVKSTYLWQTVETTADTMKATDAAKAVLTAEGLMDVSGSATMVDGKAMGKKANGAKVDVTVKKLEAGGSKVSVQVGALGDPAVGAEMATKIKAKAEGM